MHHISSAARTCSVGRVSQNMIIVSQQMNKKLQEQLTVILIYIERIHDDD